MPRLREFDPQTVLAEATQIFWRNGYADTSMEDIVLETGVSRYGLYGTFGNKKELWSQQSATTNKPWASC